MIPEVSVKTGVPSAYIAKIFQTLVQSGILDSRRGPAGGFNFRKPPELLTLYEVYEVIDDASLLVRQCVMGLNDCSSENACPLHDIWSKSKEQILKRLKNTTLHQMRKKVGKLRYRQLTRSRLAAVIGS